MMGNVKSVEQNLAATKQSIQHHPTFLSVCVDFEKYVLFRVYFDTRDHFYL